MSYARGLLGSAVLLLPGRFRAPIAKLMLGWDIHPLAKVRISYIDVVKLELCSEAEIGFGNIIKGMAKLSLGEGAQIRNCNHILGVGGQVSTLVMARGAAIMSRHYLDTTGPIVLEANCQVAGRWSQLITHSQRVRPGSNGHVTGSIRIGIDAIVGTGSILIDTDLPDGSYLAAGGVLVKRFEQNMTIYSGVPALPLRPLPFPANARFAGRIVPIGNEAR